MSRDSATVALRGRRSDLRVLVIATGHSELIPYAPLVTCQVKVGGTVVPGSFSGRRGTGP